MIAADKAPDGADIVDLPAARAARAEARAAAGTAARYIRITPGFVEVRPEMPLEVVTELEAGRIRAAVAALVIDPGDVDPVLADGTTVEDLQAIVQHLTGTSSGESAAS